jgi:hypothetical protein
MEQHISKFKLQGNIYLWKYKANTRNYPGWNFTADDLGCRSFVELLTLMRSSLYGSKKSIQLAEPTNAQTRAAVDLMFFPAQSLLVVYKKGRAGMWKMEKINGALELSFDDDTAEKLQRAVERVRNGEGDFAISDSSEENILYFWWFLEN